MRRTVILSGILFSFLLIILGLACARDETPKGTVLTFLKAVRSPNPLVLERSLSFERLISQMEGDIFQNATPEGKKVELEKFRKK